MPNGLVSDATGHIGFELGRVGNIIKYCSVQSSLKLRVSESNFVFAPATSHGFCVLKVFKKIYSSTHCFSHPKF